jgi:hypothetical protein
LEASLTVIAKPGKSECKYLRLTIKINHSYIFSILMGLVIFCLVVITMAIQN